MCKSDAKVRLFCETSGYYKSYFEHARSENQKVILVKPSKLPQKFLKIIFGGQSWVKSKDETVVKYSLESFNKPMGVASWETEIEKDIADKWKSTLPTIEEIEQELNKT